MNRKRRNLVVWLGVSQILLALILTFSTSVWAASSRRLPVAYNTSTFGGSTRDFTVAQVWADLTSKDLTAETGQGKGEVLVCYPDLPSYDQYVTLLGAIANSQYFRLIRAAPGHERQVVFNYTGETIFTVRLHEPYASLHDLVIRNNGAAPYCMDVYHSYSTGIMVGCQFGPSVNSGGANGLIIVGPGYEALGCRSYVIDCVFKYHSSIHINVWNEYSSAICNDGYYDKHYIYNCLIDGADLAFRGKGVWEIKNTIARNVLGITYGFGTFNISSSLVTTGAGDVVFEADSVHTASNDTAARDTGASLAADEYFAFSDDIDGGARPFGSAWDIGPDEYGAEAPEPETTTPVRHGPWLLDPWGKTPFNGSGKMGLLN